MGVNQEAWGKILQNIAQIISWHERSLCSIILIRILIRSKGFYLWSLIKYFFSLEIFWYIFPFHCAGELESQIQDLTEASETAVNKLSGAEDQIKKTEHHLKEVKSEVGKASFLH